MRSRAYRRFQEKKAKRKTLELVKLWRSDDELARFEITPREIGRLTSCHCQPCSCVHCGNPRRYGKLPLAEKRAALNLRNTGEEDFPAA